MAYRRPTESATGPSSAPLEAPCWGAGMWGKEARGLVRSRAVTELAGLKKKKRTWSSSSSCSSPSSRASSSSTSSSERGRRLKPQKKKGKHGRHRSPSRGGSGSRQRQRSLSLAASSYSAKSMSPSRSHARCGRPVPFLHAALQSEEESEEEEETESALSEEEQGRGMGEDSPSHYVRLFPGKDFHCLLDEVMATFNIRPSASIPAELEKEMRNLMLPLPPKEKVLPIPETLQNIVLEEWEAPCASEGLPSIPKMFFGSSGDQPDMWSVPSVDPPVIALVSSNIIPIEGEDNLKDPLDRKIESLLKKSFEADSLAARASANCSVFARAGLRWIDDILADPGMSRRSKQQLTEIRKILAFCADTSLDVLQLIARATASSTAARRALWLRYWNVDNASKLNVTALPFKGTQLFGDVLKDILVESRNKRTAMPSSTPSQGNFIGRARRSFLTRHVLPKSQQLSPRVPVRSHSRGGRPWNSQLPSTRLSAAKSSDKYLELWLKTYQVKKPPPLKQSLGRSSRHTSASTGHFTVEEILRAATWDSPSPFTVHYGLEDFRSEETAFGRRRLHPKRYDAR